MESEQRTQHDEGSCLRQEAVVVDDDVDTVHVNTTAEDIGGD